ncbi:MAG: glycosyltransferase family 39 protein [Candidatus Omnitrophica bacterium]|nr:glycosyltransferase family 39 protein [Candidatus Omnitrophota bacterium]
MNDKERSFLKKRYIYALLAALFIFHFVNNYIIIYKNEIPFEGDSLARYKQSVELFRGLSKVQDKPSFLYFLDYNFKQANHATIYTFIAAPLYAIFGVSRKIASMSNMFFLFILIWSIFLIGREFSDEYGGLLSAFIISTYPHVFAMSRMYMPDFGALAMVSLSMFLLIKSNNFFDRKYSMLFGLAVAVTIMTKLSSAHFIVAPVIFCIFQLKPWLALRSEYRSKIIAGICNLALSLFIFLTLVLPWLNFAARRYYDLCREWGADTPSLHKVPGGLSYHFVNSFLNTQLHWFYAALFFFSAIVLIFKKPRQLIFLLLWYLVPLFIMAGVTPPGYCERFTLPGLGGIAVISALGIRKISFSRSKSSICVFIICILGLIQYFLISYSPLAINIYPYMRIQKDVKDPMLRFQDASISHVGLFQAKKEDWKAEEITSVIMKDRGGYLPVKVLIIYSPFVLPGSLEEKILERQLPIRLYWSYQLFTGPPLRDGDVIDVEKIKEMNSIMEQSDYILTYDKHFMPDNLFLVPDEIYRIFIKENENNFKEIGKLAMPDNYTLHIYRRITKN